MISNSTVQRENQAKQSGLIGHAKRLIQNLGWLSPTSSLTSKGGKDFGRRIEASLTEISQGRGIMRLQLRKRDAAVVMSVDHYEEMVRMKALYAELIERVKEREIIAEADEYEELYRRITSCQSRQAADALFSATPDSLRKTYQPGRTEAR
jgi:PHD/YefM family antitoxin component YafN of YafNO toxin-antitoxin module